MNSIKEKLKQEFLADIVLSECPKTISIITSQNAANLIDFLSKKNIDQINIYPDINNELSHQSDLYIVLEDANLNVSDIGTIKNLLSQKIIVFQSKNKNNINTKDLIKLGLQKEFESKKDELHFYTYNLKTYNNKRDWNNPKGWANPENFNKFRW